MPQTMLTMAGGGPRAQVLDFGRAGSQTLLTVHRVGHMAGCRERHR